MGLVQGSGWSRIGYRGAPPWGRDARLGVPSPLAWGLCRGPTACLWELCKAAKQMSTTSMCKRMALILASKSPGTMIRFSVPCSGDGGLPWGKASERCAESYWTTCTGLLGVLCRKPAPGPVQGPQLGMGPGALAALTHRAFSPAFPANEQPSLLTTAPQPVHPTVTPCPAPMMRPRWVPRRLLTASGR